jgi:hypothetical protein
LDFISGFISNTANLWRNLTVVMDVVWSMTKSVTKLAQRHSVWTSYRASYPALRIHDEICLFVMDVVWLVTKLENIMGISSWIKGFLVVAGSSGAEDSALKSPLLDSTRPSDRPTLHLDQGVGSSGAEGFILARPCMNSNWASDRPMVSPLRPSDHPVLLSSLLFLCNSSDATK